MTQSTKWVATMRPVNLKSVIISPVRLRQPDAIYHQIVSQLEFALHLRETSTLAQRIEFARIKKQLDYWCAQQALGADLPPVVSYVIDGLIYTHALHEDAADNRAD